MCWIMTGRGPSVRYRISWRAQLYVYVVLSDTVSQIVEIIDRMIAILILARRPS